jgi:ribose/xylose/arabinose/galactoside ABC-type transport system permease subunit
VHSDGSIGAEPLITSTAEEDLRWTARLGTLMRGKGRNVGLLLALTSWIAIVAWHNSLFVSTSNLKVIGLNMSYAAIAGIGTTFLIVTGSIDLSIGSNFALAAVSSAMMAKVMPVELAFLCGILVSGAVGLINGVLTWKVPVSPIIITLGGLSLLHGLVLVISHGYGVPGVPDDFTHFGRSEWFGVPMAVVVMVIVALLAAVVLYFTTIGRHCYAVGGSRAASAAAGLNVRLIHLSVFVFSGLLVGLAGILAASRFGQPDATYGVGFELVVITGVILGGVSFAGGEGGVIGALLGIAMLSVIDAGIVSLNVDAYYAEVVKGAILIIAVSADQFAQVQRERFQKVMAMREQARVEEERQRHRQMATAAEQR